MKSKPFKFFFAAAIGLMLFFFVARILFGALLIAGVLTLGFYMLKTVKQMFRQGMQTASVWQNDEWAKVDRLDADLYYDIKSSAYQEQAGRKTIEIH